MELTRTRVITGLFDEYDDFCALVTGLSPVQWDTPTRCEGWLVRDVAAHVLGAAADTLDGSIGRRSPDEQAAALRGLDPATLSTTLREAVGGLRPRFEKLTDDLWLRPSGLPGMTIGEGLLTLWYDLFMHGDDIRAALGLPSRRGLSLAAAVECLRHRLTRSRWGPARFELDGFGEVEFGDDGPLLRGDPFDFVLVASGRADPAIFGVDESINVHR